MLAEVARVEEVVLHRVAERQGGDGQVEALDTDGGETDHHRGRHSGGDPDGHRLEEVDVVVADEPAGDARRRPHQPALAQADLARPAGENDHRHGHDCEQGDDGDEGDVGDRHQERSRHRDGDRRDQQDHPRRLHLA